MIAAKAGGVAKKRKKKEGEAEDELAQQCLFLVLIKGVGRVLNTKNSSDWHNQLSRQLECYFTANNC